jgi:tetratricopeptide (TPR) repeat protein
VSGARRAGPAGPLLLLLALLPPLPVAGQAGPGRPGDLALADSLLDAGDRGRARAAYEAVLARDPDSSRALYRLATLQPAGSAGAVSLLRRYTALEPDDAWGHLALGEALLAAGETAGALLAFDRSAALEPADGEIAWARAQALGERGAEGAARRAGTGPAVEPLVRVARDSDGNTVLWSHLALDAPVAEGLRVGLAGGWTQSVDGDVASSAREGALTLGWRPPGSLQLRAAAGLARTQAPEIGLDDATIPLLRLRARWRPADGPAAELRLQHEPVTATPRLLGTPIVLSEARGSVDLPVRGPLHLRGLGRLGRLQARERANTRTSLGGGPVLRLGGGELGGFYHRTGYAGPTDAGYFAPQRVEALELAAYGEYYGAWPLTLALDVGVGTERITPWNAPAGGWEPAFRLWSQLARELRPGRELRLEAEAYDTRAGAALVPEAGGWRWGSLALGMRYAVR